MDLDPKRRKILLYIAGALLLIAVALLPVAWALSQQDETEIERVPKPPDLGLPNDGLITTGTPDGTTTSTPEGSGSGGSGASSSGSSRGLSAAEIAALEAELGAIEKSLDSMSMPNDSDFKDIESGLQ